ncbi:MAG: autotransporter-associated beta strand repeat-containing protein, partial [Verrucomicrobiota bacterium]
MKPRYRSTFPSFILAGSIASMAFTASAIGGTIVWSGPTGGDIDDGANWGGGAIPSVVTPDVAQWDGTSAGNLALVHNGTGFAGAVPNVGININVTATNTDTLSIDSGANVSAVRLSNITIANGAGAFTLGDGAGAFNLTLGGAPSTQTWTNDSASVATINSDVSMGLGGGGAHTLALLGTGNWAFNNIISNGGGTTTLTKGGAGTATLAGANTYTGSTTVSGGVLNLTGTASMTGGFFVNGGGTLALSGPFGTNATNNTFIAGQAAGKGIITIPAGVTITRANIFAGDNSAGDGAIYQSGGTVTLTQVSTDTLRIGSSASGKGYYRLSGGNLNVGEVGIGASQSDTVGVMDVTAGTLSDSGWLTLSRGTASSSGVLNVTGGTVTAARLEMAGTNTLNANSLSVLNVGGGGGPAAVSTTASTTLGLNLLSSGNVAGVQGIANLLTNGTLTTGIVNASASANPTALLNFNGGTLKATATNAGAAFMTSANIDGVNIYSNGGTVDNSATNITIGRDLAAPAGNGLNATPTVDTGGAGYIGAPMVKITGGGGIGATAVATVSGGVVTAVTITNPGTGYTSAPAIAFVGGGASTAATATAPAPTANASGPMNFIGSGTTTLSGLSSFTGLTTVTTGVLAFNRANNTVTTFSNNITGTGGISNTGSGRVIISGSNNYAGNTTVTAGILHAPTTGSLPNFGTLGKVQLTGTSRIGVSSGAWTAANIDTLLANATFGANTTGLAIDTTAGDFSYGPITGAKSFTKLGSNQLTFSGTNSYTGATFVNAGTLLIDGGSVSSTTITGQSFIVNNTGTGTGTITQINNAIVSGGPGEMWVGNGVGSTGIYNLNSGSLTVNNWLTPGRDGSTGTINVTGGTLTHTNSGSSGGRFSIASGGGAAGTGTINQTGGAVTDSVSLIITETGGTGTYNISGGTLDANTNISMSRGAGPSVLNLQNAASGPTGGLANGGGGQIVTTPEVVMGDGGAGTSTVHLDGGTLAVNRVRNGAGAGTKAFNFNGGTLQLRTNDSGSAMFVSGVTTTVNTGGAKVNTNGFNGTISTVLAHAGAGTDGGVIKTGAGTLTLTGPNTFTGPLTANGGKLLAGAAVAFPTGVDLVSNPLTSGNLDFNGQYRVASAAPAGKTFANLTAGANSEFVFNFNTASGVTTGDSIAITNAATVTPGAKLTVSVVPGTTLTAGTYTLFSGAGGLDNFALSSSGITTGGFFYPLSLNATPTADTLTIGAAQIAKLYYTGNGGNDLLSNAANFAIDAPGLTPASTGPTAITDIVLSANAGTSGNFSPTLDTVTAANFLQFTGTGTPAASTSINLSGPGTLTINAGLNSFAAGTGIVVDSGAAAHSISANLALGASQSFTNNSASTFTVSGNINGGGSGLTLAGTGPIALSGVLSNLGSLTNSGPGTLALTNQNTYTGSSNINGGTVALGSAENAGTSGPLGNGGTINFLTSGGILQYSASNQFDYSGRFATAGAQQFKIDTNGQNVTFANNLTGPGGTIQKYGTGTLTLASTATNSTAQNLFTRGGTLLLDTGAKITTTAASSVGFATGDSSTVSLAGTSQLTATDLNVSDATGSYGVLNIADTAAVKGNTMYVGKSGTATGVVNQTGGSFSPNAASGDWRIGGGTGAGDAAAVGIYNISAGTLTTSVNFQPGAYGNGQLNISGTGAVTATGGFLGIGRFATGYGVVDVSGSGSFGFTVAGNRLIVAEDGTGILNVRGGTVTNASNSTTAALTVGNTATANGTVNLLGGTLTTASVGTNNATASSRINFNGGTLKASAASATYLTGLSSAYVYAGGANIDADNKAITIGQILQSPAASSGVQSISVTDGGTGYTTAPIVKLTGGGGTGATAVATVAGGAITQIIVTSPGVNYTGAPTVTLVSGLSGGSGAILSPNVAANTSGGLAVSSTTPGGVVTLTAANTFTGDATINTGTTLQLGNGTTLNDGTLSSTNVTNNGSLIYNRFGAAVFTGTIVGTGSVTKLGAGTQTLSGTNTYTGATTVGGGILSVASIQNGGVNSNIGASTAAPANLVFSGGTLFYTGASTSTDRGFTINAGGGTISNAVELTIAGQVLVGAGTTSGFTKNGIGTLNF